MVVVTRKCLQSCASMENSFFPVTSQIPEYREKLLILCKEVYKVASNDATELRSNPRRQRVCL